MEESEFDILGGRRKDDRDMKYEDDFLILCRIVCNLQNSCFYLNIINFNTTRKTKTNQKQNTNF